jgi:hypothetical protein
MIAIQTVGRWGRRPLYAAKIGSGSSACVVVKRARKFAVEQRIEFANERDLRGMSTGQTPKWRVGYIWLIEDERLFIRI